MTTINLAKYEKHCDIFLVDEKSGEKWPMISTLLQCKSSYFEALLGKQWNTEQKNEFLISTNETWIKIRIWIFTGKFCFKPSEYCLALKFADMYDFEELIEVLISKMVNIEFKFVEKHLEFLLQERFFEILIHFRSQIIQSIFQPTGVYAFLAAIVSREQIRKNVGIQYNSNWITMSATFAALQGKNKFKIIDNPNEYQLLMTLIDGLSLRVKNIDIKVRIGEPPCIRKIQYSVFGIANKNELILIGTQEGLTENSHNKNFSRFLISSKRNLNEPNLSEMLIQGDYVIKLKSQIS